MVTGNSTNLDRLQQLKAFEESKAGVKGLVDAGITKIPPIFIRPPGNSLAGDPCSDNPTQTQLSIPVVDLADISDRRDEVVAGVRQAAETVGFFQVANHGIHKRVLEEMLAAVRRFHELPYEVKAEYYTSEPMKKFKFTSNSDLYHSQFASWKDTLFCNTAPEPLDPQELPQVCRDITMEYSDQVHKLGVTLFELLSEALGLKCDHLINLECAKGHIFLGHYYPPCPEPELTMGSVKHSDPDFLTILLQDQIGGLQVLFENQWVDVPHVPGALVVNIGDLLQLITNGRFISVKHKVIAQRVGPRISVASFLRPTTVEGISKVYGPIKELLSEGNPQIYRETNLKDYLLCYRSQRVKGNTLANLKL